MLMTNFYAPIRNFLTAPAHLAREQQRFFGLWTICCCLGVVNHMSYIPLFYWMGLKRLAIQSILAVFIWAVGMWLGRRGYIYTAINLCAAELFFYIALCARYTGWESGVQYLLFQVAAIVFIFPFHPWYTAFWVVAAPLEFILIDLSFGKVGWTGNPLALRLFWFANTVLPFGSISLVVGYQANLVRDAEQAMDKAHARSEALLNNVLPQEIASRLKQSDTVIADHFPAASVLFADIVSFTPLAQSMTPTDVVQMLNDLFSHIDVLVRQHKLEKIKTIGDAYMVAAGIPSPRDDHAEAIVAFAFDLQKSLVAYNTETGRNLHLRIGINSGPVVAGVIGKLRFLYDLWGDSVNTASRMESHGLPDEIQVTEETRHLLAEKYEFTDRGVIEVKGKGPMRTYFLRERQQEVVD